MNTSDSTDNVAAGSGVTFRPASMTNIYPGAALVVDSGAAQETVIVAGATATSFAASTVHAHNGTAAPFAITSDPALTAAVASLAAASQQAVGPFFAAYPELRRCTRPTSPRRTRCRRADQPAGQLPAHPEGQAKAGTGTRRHHLGRRDRPQLRRRAAAEPDHPARGRRRHPAGGQRPGGRREPGAVGAVLPRRRPVRPARSPAGACPTRHHHQRQPRSLITRSLPPTPPRPCWPAASPPPSTPPPHRPGHRAADQPGRHRLGQRQRDHHHRCRPGRRGRLLLAGLRSFRRRHGNLRGGQPGAGTGRGIHRGHWSGYITAPQDGFYDISVAADPGARITCELGGAAVPMAQAAACGATRARSR